MNNTKEIKKILMGKIIINEDGSMQLKPKYTYTGFTNVFAGFAWVLLFGVTSRTRVYHCEYKPNKAKKLIGECIERMGRTLHLEDNPDATAVLTGYPISKPGVMALEYNEKDKGTDITVIFFTGRSPLCLLRCMRQLHKLDRGIGDLAERVRE